MMFKSVVKTVAAALVIFSSIGTVTAQPMNAPTRAAASLPHGSAALPAIGSRQTKRVARDEKLAGGFLIPLVIAVAATIAVVAVSTGGNDSNG